ncbi:ankyrin [Thozetella sp. PMI_491]|nr:ankyrin [Thozetella sp. PMI_491]
MDYLLMCVAAYVGDIALVEQLLHDSSPPATGFSAGTDIFPTPIDCAALGGNADIIRLFRKTPACCSWRETHLGGTWHLPRWWSQIGCLKGALHSGNVDLVRLAAEPFRAKVATVSESKEHRQWIVEALKYAANREAYEELRGILPAFDRVTEEKITDELLRCYTIWGNLALVQALIPDYGVRVRHPRQRRDDNLLVNAAGFFHGEMVDFLLDHGADVNEGEGTRRGSALSAAAAAGSYNIVRKLLDRGAHIVGKDYERAVIYALRREHTAMVELLLDRNDASSEARAGNMEEKAARKKRLIGIAKSEGLESMAEPAKSRE